MSQKLKIVLVASFVAVDLILLFFVQRQMSDTQVTSASAPLPAGSAPTATSSPETDVPNSGVALSGGGTLFTYDGGACDGSAQPELKRSSDQGRKFTSISLPEGVSAVYGVDPSNRDGFAVTAADGDCKTARYVTKDGGESWDKNKDGSWYVDFDAKKLHSPDGVKDPKCSPVRVNGFDDDNAQVACADGSITGTDDGGKSWKKVGELSNVFAFAYRSDSDGFALAETDKCAAQSFVTTDAGTKWKKGACIDAKDIGGPAANDDILAGVVDGDVYLSDDNADSWAKP